jgi:tetratricopeptide (TPR) repeat protein
VRRALFGIGLCLAVLVGPSARAAAQEVPANVVEARERVTRGEALFARGDYDAALAEFEAAYETIGEHPSRFLVLYNIGQCHERRFRYDVALAYYRRYLEGGGRTVEGHDAVEENVRVLEGLLSRVEVSTSAVGAEAFVDGRSVGAVPGEILVPAGLHVISVRAEGYVPAERELEVPASGRIDLALEPTRLSDEYHGISPAFALSAAGLALVGLGVGIGLGVAAVNERAGIDRQLADPVARWSVTDASFDGVRSLALSADLFYAGAAVFALTAVILGILTDWTFGASTHAGETAHVRLTVGGLEGAF